MATCARSKNHGYMLVSLQFTDDQQGSLNYLIVGDHKTERKIDGKNRTFSWDQYRGCTSFSRCYKKGEAEHSQTVLCRSTVWRCRRKWFWYSRPRRHRDDQRFCKGGIRFSPLLSNNLDPSETTCRASKTFSNVGWRYGPSYAIGNEKRNSLSGKFRRARMV